MTRVVLKGLTLWNFVFGVYACVLCFIFVYKLIYIGVRIDFVDLTWEKKEFWNVHLLMTEFAHPKVTLGGCQDLKLLLLAAWS